MANSPTPTVPRQRLLTLVYFLFFASGLCGLVYEIIWMRRFTVIFGNTTYAVTVVLTAFMAGLAAGSYLFGRLADNPRRRASLFSYYGWMEIAVGVYCLGFEQLVEIEKGMLLWLYSAADPGPQATLLIKFGLSVLLLLLPTLLMGGTLPVLIKALSRGLPDVGRITGRLYFINCLGAVGGTLAVAFWLIPSFGLSFSTALAASLNILVGVLAIGLRGRVPEASPAADEQAAPAVADKLEAAASTGEPVPHAALRWAVAGIFVSGFTAMVYEVSWVRVLSLVLGSSTYSFALMLAAFISGIALGSYLISRWMDRIRRPALAFALIQLAVGASVLATMPLYSHLPVFFIRARALVNFSYEAHEAFKFLVCFGVMAVPTTLIGTGFPLVSRIAAVRRESLASSVGSVYAVNTVGNILGSALCGLVLIPLLGLRITLDSAVALNMAAGLAILFALGPARLTLARRATVSVALALALYYLLVPGWDRHLLTAGAFRYHQRPGGSSDNFVDVARAREFIYYNEGISTTVTVERKDTLLMMRVNGKVDASNGLDMDTQIMQAHLPMLLHPDPRRILVIGAGSGVTAGSALHYPELEDLWCVEISPGVIEASELFAPLNNYYWKDERCHIVIDDGRNFLFRTREKFDIITSEPSNPWIAGIGSLYTDEFYASCREHLTEEGIICQWIHLYEMEESVLRTIVVTFLRHFPGAVAFASMENNDMLLIGSPRRIDPDLGLIAGRMDRPGIRSDLAQVGIESLFTLLTTQIFGNKSLRHWAGIAPVNTDNFPVVEYNAPRGFFYADRVLLPDRYRVEGRGTLLARYLEKRPVSADELVELARYQMKSGHMTNMIYSALDDALAIEPEHPEALELMTRLLIERMKYDEAYGMLERLADAGAPEKTVLELEYPVASALARRLTGSFLRKPDFSRPLAIVRRLLEIDGEKSIHYYHLGETWEQMREYATAARAYEKALELRAKSDDDSVPEPFLLMHQAGSCWLDAGELEKAAGWFAVMDREYPERGLGADMLKIVAMEKLIREAGPIDADRVREALEPPR